MTPRSAAPAMQWWTGTNESFPSGYSMPQIPTNVLSRTIADRVSILTDKPYVSIGDGMRIEKVANDNIAIRADADVLPSHALETALTFARKEKWSRIRMYHPKLPLAINCFSERPLPVVFGNHNSIDQFRNQALETAEKLTLGTDREIGLSAVYDPTPDQKNGIVLKITSRSWKAGVVARMPEQFHG